MSCSDTCCIFQIWDGERAYLDELVPTSGDNDGVLGVGAEAHARDPLRVALLGDGVLAVTQSVPQLDGLVTGTRDDLAVVGGERDRQDVRLVADESAGGGTGGELPQAEGLVPRGGQSVGAVGGDHLFNVRICVHDDRHRPPHSDACKTGFLAPGGCHSQRSSNSQKFMVRTQASHQQKRADWRRNVRREQGREE